MLTDALIVFHKETGNLLRDPRAVFSNFILPLILMPLVFAAMGLVQANQQKSLEVQDFSIAVVGTPDPRFMELLQGSLRFTTQGIPRAQDGLTLEFGEGGLTVFVDESSMSLSWAASRVKDVVGAYNLELSTGILAAKGLDHQALNPFKLVTQNLASPEIDQSGGMVVLLPYLLILYLCTGPLGLAIQVTAGEKEQGSLASLLVNQVSRTSIALGKTLYVVFSGLVNAVMSMVGLIIGFYTLSLVLGESGGGFGGMTGGIGILQDPLAILSLLGVMLVTSAMASSLLVGLGSLAKNLKEAGGYSLPVLLVVMVIGVSTMQMDPPGNLGMYCIPILNSVFAMKLVLLDKLTLLPLVLTMVANGVLSAVVLYLTSKLYKSERILYTV